MGLSATKDERIRMILPERLPLMVQAMSMSAATASDWGRVLIMPPSSMCRMRDRVRRLDRAQFRRCGRSDSRMRSVRADSISTIDEQFDLFCRLV
jgi:hypothetical protein